MGGDMNWPWSPKQQRLEIDYWLPITKVNVTGTGVSATASYGERGKRPEITKKATPAVVSIVTRPDYSRPCHLNVLADDWAERKAKLGLLPDGRLTSADTSAQDDRGEGLKAALTMAALGAGVGGSFGPVGAAIGIGAGLILGGAEPEIRRAAGENGTHEALRNEDGGDGSSAGARPAAASGTSAGSDPDTHIRPGYVSQAPGEARLLADLRIRESQARLAFGATARDSKESTADTLKTLSDRLKLIRTELARSEALYQQWLDGCVTTTSTPYDEEVEIKALPVSGRAQEWLNDAEKNASSFYNACTALGVVVTCDFEKGPPQHAVREHASGGGQEPDRDGFIYYRVLRPAVLRAYAGKPNGTSLKELGTQRILVAMKGYEHSVPAFDAGEKQSLSVSFDSTGALTSISNDTTGAAASAASELGDLPSGIKDAFDTGTDIATPFTPGGRAKILQDQLDEINNRAALSPAPNPNKKLEDEVAQAELQARLKVAGQVASGQASSAVVILGNTAQSAS